jgi:hypothetical protein
VTALDWFDLAGISSLEPLRDYSNLESFRVQRGTIDDLAPLTDLPRLADLKLYSEVKAKKNLAMISHLRALRTLTIAKGYEYLAGSGLELENLCVTRTQIELEHLSGLVTLRNLALGNNWASFSDLGPLRDLVRIESLSLHSHKATSLEPLTDMRRMRELNPGGGASMKSLTARLVINVGGSPASTRYVYSRSRMPTDMGGFDSDVGASPRAECGAYFGLRLKSLSSSFTAPRRRATAACAPWALP